jgi:hypothetical protein
MSKVLNGPEFVPGPAEGLFADMSVRWEETRWGELAYESEFILPCVEEERMRFCPYDSISRAQVALMIVRALGLELR